MDDEFVAPKEEIIKICYRCKKPIDINKTAHGMSLDDNGEHVYHHIFDCVKEGESGSLPIHLP
jgi:hypothetical protein